MERLLHTVTVLAWIVLAAALFFAFGLIVGSGSGRVVVSLGWLPDTRRLWVTDGVWVVGGVLLLGLSRVYRRLADEDNAGSIGAWLAGWALLLCGASSALALVSGVAVVAFLIAVLAVWEFRMLVQLTEAAGDHQAAGGCEAAPEDEATDDAGDLPRLDAHIRVSRGDGPCRARSTAGRRMKVGGPRR